MSADKTAFRADVRAWAEANGPAPLRGTRKGRFDGWWGGTMGPPSDAERAWFEACLERGYTAPTWPTEYGGAGLDPVRARILDEELHRLELPPPLVGFGLTMIGPTLLDYGNEAQKAEHLPKIVRGEVRWCQGYSEPEAGSDLASLRTSAVQDGDHFVVNGQKIWTSHADKSDWIFALVRTDPDVKKQLGITFLLIDMRSPGIEARTIELISGASPFCEVFFTDVRVPLTQVVGEINAGWTVAKALLGYERTMVGEAMGGQVAGAEERIVAAARARFGSDEGRLPDAELRSEIARCAMDEARFRWVGSASPSALKVFGSELKQRRWELAQQAAGPDGVEWSDTARQWLRSRANTIEGGSTEIQLNVIARRILGLPK